MAAPNGSPFRLVLVAVDDDLARAWGRHCRDLPGVEVHRGSILDVKCDAVGRGAEASAMMPRTIKVVQSAANSRRDQR